MKYSNHARAAGVVGAAGTVAGLLLWALQPAPGSTSDRLIIAAVFTLPVIAALIGLARGRSYTAAWAAMLAVLYMAFTLSEYLVAGPNPGIWLTLVSSSLLFAGSALYPRLRSRET